MPGKTMTTEEQVEYVRALNRLYEGELHAIDEMLTVVGVPAEANDEDLSALKRVRWLIDQYLDLKGVEG